MRKIILDLLYELEYVFLNFFVNRIPIWLFRLFFYKMVGLKIGRNSRIGLGTILICPHKIHIMERTIINQFCLLDGRGELWIGNDSSISTRSAIVTGTHDAESSDFIYCANKVIIKDRVWIGSQAIILDNSYIDNEAIIGSGCVFKGIARKNEIYIGNPAKLLRKRKNVNKYKCLYKPKII